MHAQEGYCSQSVCMSVCLSFLINRDSYEYQTWRYEEALLVLGTRLERLERKEETRTVLLKKSSKLPIFINHDCGDCQTWIY